MLAVYRGLQYVIPPKPFSMPRDPAGNLTFVVAYIVVNSVFFTLANGLTLAVLWVRKEGLRSAELALYFFTFFLNAVSMAVVTPYDQLGYFFLVIGVAGMRTRKPWVSYLLVGTSAVLGILNRETEFLLAGVFVALALSTVGERSRWFWRLGTVHFVLCLMAYIGLRIYIHSDTRVAGGLAFEGRWLVPLLLLAMLFGASCVLAQSIVPMLRPALIYIFCCLPYLVTVLLTGVLTELRLLVPLVFCVLCLYALLHREMGSERGLA